jgi:hypothetical protein
VTTAAATVGGAVATPTIGGQGGVGVPASGLGGSSAGSISDNMASMAVIALILLTLIVSGGFFIAKAGKRGR